MSEVVEEMEPTIVKPGEDVVVPMTKHFRFEIMSLIQEGKQNLVIDLEGVEMFDSDGLGVLIAAYKQLWEENHPDRPITGGYHLLRFDKEHADFTHHFWTELDEAWSQFQIFRQAYDIDKRLKKRT